MGHVSILVKVIVKVLNGRNGFNMQSYMTPEEAKSKFVKFRDKPFRMFQEGAIQWAMESKKFVKVIKAKTGAGKSLISMVCGAMSGDLTYLVQSKFLQTQITNDFNESVSVWGRANYVCINNPDRNCAECLSTKKNPCPVASGCLYTIAKQQALAATYRVLNFSYYINECFHVGRFAGNRFTVIDEADSLEQVLSENVQLKFSERSLFRLGLQDGPKFKTSTAKEGLSSWREFGEEALSRSNKLACEIQKEIDTIPDNQEELKLQKLREKEYFVHLSERSQIFLSNMDKEWLFEEITRQGSKQGCMIFRPTWLSNELAHEYLWKNSDSFLLLSATFPPVPIMAKLLGLDVDDIDFLELPSTFDPEKSPVHIWPVANVVYKNMEQAVPMLIKAIRAILERHKGERGIIHTVSWKLNEQIVNGVNSPRLITHDSQTRQSVVNEFSKDDGIYDADSVFCSPSSERGIDLKDDLARFVIIVKCPFLNTSDKLVASRLWSRPYGQPWYQSEALGTVEQMSGRATRSDEDYSVIYILDQQVKDLYEKKPSLFSNSFREQISWEPNQLLDD